jgi:hypothetical protein
MFLKALAHNTDPLGVNTNVTFNEVGDLDDCELPIFLFSYAIKGSPNQKLLLEDIMPLNPEYVLLSNNLYHILIFNIFIFSLVSILQNGPQISPQWMESE